MNKTLISRLTWVVLTAAILLAGIQAYLLLRPSSAPSAVAHNDLAASPAPAEDASARADSAASPDSITPGRGQLPNQPIATAITQTSRSVPRTRENADAMPDQLSDGSALPHSSGPMHPSALAVNTATPLPAPANAEPRVTPPRVANTALGMSPQSDAEAIAPTALRTRTNPAAAEARRTTFTALTERTPAGGTSPRPNSRASMKQASNNAPDAFGAPNELQRGSQHEASLFRTGGNGDVSLAADFELYRNELEGIDGNLPAHQDSNRILFELPGGENAQAVLHWQADHGRISSLSADLLTSQETRGMRLVVHLLRQSHAEGAEVLDLGLYLIRLPEPGEQKDFVHRAAFLRLSADGRVERFGD